MLTLLPVLLAGDVGEAREEAGCALRPLGGGGRSVGGGDGTFRPSISAASFSSVALRSATRSAMSASKSLSSSSWRDSGVRRNKFSAKTCFETVDLICYLFFKMLDH